jgi:DNA invertase Pin-like site-specific DNA recombinase
MTFYAYIRVSTPRQGERHVSLQEQRAAIERFAERNHFEVARWFEERETAAKRGRREWTEMLRLLRQGKAKGVLIHKIDRSARNLRDWAELGELIDRGVAVHFVNETLDLQTRGGRLSADIQAVVAADFIRNLREETLKGINGRLSQGIFPMQAPIGYLDCGAGRPKAIDPVKGPLARRAFELYATGRYSLHILREELNRLGLRNRLGREVSINSLAGMLRNPFYTGLIKIKRRGEVYEGIHKPLISRSLFERVQAALDGKLSTRPLTHDFVFRRTLHCTGCGYALIGERQKGYVYYRCHTRTCPRTSVREEGPEMKLAPLLQAAQLDPEERDYIREKIGNLTATWEDGAAKERKTIDLQLNQLAARRGRLADAVVDGLLDRDLFEERKGALLAEKQALEERLAALDDPERSGPQKLAEFLERLDSAYSLYQSGTNDEKRELVAFFTSNWQVNQKTIDFTTLPEAKLVAERAKNWSGAPYRDVPRTWDKLLLQLAGMISAKLKVDPQKDAPP